MKKSKDDILRLVEENDVKFIRLQFTDIFGMGKNVAITKQQLEGALDNKIMFDGSSVEGFVRIEESDMFLYPDYDSFVILPWKPQQGREARLICDVYTPNGTPFAGGDGGVTWAEVAAPGGRPGRPGKRAAATCMFPPSPRCHYLHVFYSSPPYHRTNSSAIEL